MILKDTIVAPATPPGSGALGIIRISGKDAITIADKIFYGKKSLESSKSHRSHFGEIRAEGEIIDEVIATVFKNPTSFTGEDSVEFSCHGSSYIIQKILQLLISNGARTAEAGEFTLRAFMNGRMDLSQAEAVADLIASESEAAHRLAMSQMRGGFSKQINELREQLLNFASLIELELDFSEEDVEFADRKELKSLLDKILVRVRSLASTFHTGNAIKRGVPVVIAGAPNAGKSTLLNTLLNEDRAIVSETAGTTRDVIEDEITIEGINFRFIDTAGLRETHDEVEIIGIRKAYEKIEMALVVIYLFDAATTSPQDVQRVRESFEGSSSKVLCVINKMDLTPDVAKEFSKAGDVLFISARDKKGIEELKERLVAKVVSSEIKSGDVMVTNARHYEALKRAGESLEEVLSGLKSGITSDLLAIDLRKSLYHLGEITGAITTDDVLGNIFSKFCIGK